MTTKYLTGTYIAAGYTIVSGVTELILSHTAGVGGIGIFASGFKTIDNEGFVDGHAEFYGINLASGGDVTNGSATYTGASIQGFVGISTHGHSAVTNYGVIEGIASAAYGSNSAINEFDGGSVTNGTAGDKSALIEGAIGVYVGGAVGAVVNFGSILSNDAHNAVDSAALSGVYLSFGGGVTNGSLTDGAALIEGPEGIGAQNSVSYVINYGSIKSDTGDAIYFGAGGLVQNGVGSTPAATIVGVYGVVITGGAGHVFNSGTIKALSTGTNGIGIRILGGGNVINGSAIDGTALILGGGSEGVFIAGGPGTVTNYGSIDCGNGYGVLLGDGGSVTNAAAATIVGDFGVAIVGGFGDVINSGTIEALRGGYGASGGVNLYDGGRVTNGSATDTTALIQGDYQAGVEFFGGGGTVVNYGSIRASDCFGIILFAGGSVTNGANTATGAIIDGALGVVSTYAATVVNFGTIAALYGVSGVGVGVEFYQGGSITNGSGTDRHALIQGAQGVIVQDVAGSVTNSGTILGEGSGFGVELLAGGDVTNGRGHNTAALIQGYSGLYLDGGNASNNGTIAAVGDYGIGVQIDGAGVVANGSAGHTVATIDGWTGVTGAAGSTAFVINYGTIEGDSGTAVRFLSSTDILGVAAGSTFLGQVLGGGGALALISGTGTLSGLTGAAVTVSGSMAATTFSDFGTVEVAGGAVFTLTGAATLLAGQTVASSGMLTATSSVANGGLLESSGGTLIVSGAVIGSGSATVSDGTLDFASSFNQAVTFVTGGTLELAKSQTYTASITGFSKTGATSLDLVDIGFVKSTEATFSGTKSGGVLTVTDGTHTAKINLKGNYLSSSFIASSDGHGGTIVIDPKEKGGAAPVVIPSPHPLIAAMASLGPGTGVGWASQMNAAAGPLLAPRLLAPRVALA